MWKLLQRYPRSIDIEHVDETDEHVVEMVSPRKLIHSLAGLLLGK